MGVSITLTSDRIQFQAAPHPKFSYGTIPVGDELFFGAVSLLFEKGIKPQNIRVETSGGEKIFFQLDTIPVSGALEFDPFAAGFFMVSRYEEYLPHVKDQFQRFPARESLAFRNDFLHIPVVNRYAEMIKRKITERYPEVHFPAKQFEFIPTYDIDSAYAYLNKGWIRNIGGLVRSAISADWASCVNRILVLTRQKKDPFDTYGWLHQLHEKYNLRPIYFFLVGDYDEYDKNISITMSEYRELISSIADHADVGIHPSYASNTDFNKLKKEVLSLAQVLKRDITKSRQHFLKLEMPKTYQHLCDLDITDDYTMGFATQPGFRAGICSSFYFYNLHIENKTHLRIHPFAVMDATLNYYHNLAPRQFPDIVYPIIDEIKKAGGTFISIWHNNSLSEENEWSGWRRVYEDMIRYTLGKE